MLDWKFKLQNPVGSLNLCDIIFMDYTTLKMITLYFCFWYLHVTNGNLITLEFIVLCSNSNQILMSCLSLMQFSALDCPHLLTSAPEHSHYHPILTTQSFPQCKHYSLCTPPLLPQKESSLHIKMSLKQCGGFTDTVKQQGKSDKVATAL